nr:MAG TPA: hypothetical protein [Caudoviricetes sp.]
MLLRTFLLIKNFANTFDANSASGPFCAVPLRLAFS